MAKRTGKKDEMTLTRYPGLYRLEKGGWWINCSQRDHTGHRVWRRKQLAPDLTLEEANRERAAVVLALEAELRERAEEARRAEGAAKAGAAGPRPTTVASYSNIWLAQKKAEGIRQNTIDRYVQAICGRILPPIGDFDGLGDVPIVDVTRDHLIRWRTALQAMRLPNGAEYSRESLRSWWRIAVNILRDAAAEYGFTDPTARLSSPKSGVKRKRETQTLSVEQLGGFIAAVQVHAPDWYDEVFVDAFTGLRPGELYALRWPNVRDADRVIRIEEAVDRHGNVYSTKTDEPRDVALIDAIRTLLANRRRRMLAQQDPGLELGLVFPNSKGEHRLGPALAKVTIHCGREAGIPFRVTPQVLRRTINTLLVEQGVANLVIQSQIGHCSDQMTKHYFRGHVEAKQRAVGQLFRQVAGHVAGAEG